MEIKFKSKLFSRILWNSIIFSLFLTSSHFQISRNLPRCHYLYFALRLYYISSSPPMKYILTTVVLG
jgi:hypothetical protein